MDMKLGLFDRLFNYPSKEPRLGNFDMIWTSYGPFTDGVLSSCGIEFLLEYFLS